MLLDFTNINSTCYKHLGIYCRSLLSEKAEGQTSLAHETEGEIEKEFPSRGPRSKCERGRAKAEPACRPMGRFLPSAHARHAGRPDFL